MLESKFFLSFVKQFLERTVIQVSCPCGLYNLWHVKKGLLHMRFSTKVQVLTSTSSF
uniref:Uncharacterized protein n=1 Tax=Solanum lycopersicum TaxID=4081 RepID=A0A3Q7EVL3_SOLLC